MGDKIDIHREESGRESLKRHCWSVHLMNSLKSAFCNIDIQQNPIMTVFEAYKIQKSFRKVTRTFIFKTHHHKPRNYFENLSYISKGFGEDGGPTPQVGSGERIEPEAQTAQSGLSVSDLIPDDYLTGHFMWRSVIEDIFGHYRLTS